MTVVPHRTSLTHIPALFLPFQGLCDRTEPTWVLQANLSISQSLTLVISVLESPVPCKVTYSQALWLSHGYFGDLLFYLPYSAELLFCPKLSLEANV